MDFSSLNLLSGLTERMRFLSNRSNVIAQNIANADTPGYRAKEISPPDFEALVEHTQAMRVNDSRHQAGYASLTSSNNRIKTSSQSASLDGNSVSIETETMKLSQTRMEYGLASTVYRKGLDMLRLAIRSDR